MGIEYQVAPHRAREDNYVRAIEAREIQQAHATRALNVGQGAMALIVIAGLAFTGVPAVADTVLGVRAMALSTVLPNHPNFGRRAPY